MKEKIKTIQEKYKIEVCNNNEKDEKIKFLNENIHELYTRLHIVEKENAHINKLLKQEQEKYLQMEKELITAENKLFS